MKIHSDFDSGSIEVVAAERADDIRLRLCPDNQATVSQWFHFELQTVAGVDHRIAITNAGDSTFADAWRDYQVMARNVDEDGDDDNGEGWFRVPTRYDGRQLLIEHRPGAARIRYAYFVPYDAVRQQRMTQEWRRIDNCRLEVLGETPDGRPMELLVIGDEAPEKSRVWLIARQHPGESMAQWFAEGVVSRLLGDEVLAEQLLRQAVFYIVPNMNPDGAVRGNHRTNSRGANLNRCWQSADPEVSPEVFYVRQAIQRRGVDLFFDIHGDEAIPYNFMMVGGDDKRLLDEAAGFKARYAAADRHFQTAYDYSSYRPAGSCCCAGGCCGASSNGLSLANATNYVAATFDCLALVLEMPFVDDANHPSPQTGWSASRSMAMGRSLLTPIGEYLSRNAAD